MRRLVLVWMCVCVVLQSHAFPCFITVVKDSCWTDYTVRVDVVDFRHNNLITTLVIPASKSFKRYEFVCEPGQTVAFNATFTPSFWEKEAGKVYSSQRSWSFPETIGSGQSAWNMTLCFSGDFLEVPLPPTGSGHCVCDKAHLPKIEPRSS